MPIPKDIAAEKIGIPSPGDVWVFVDQYGGAERFTGSKIPLDGRKYLCDGKVIFKNGFELRAKFRLDTTGPQFLKKEFLICYYNGLWYGYDEPALFKATGLRGEEALPLKWVADIPLDYHLPGPYEIDHSKQENTEGAKKKKRWR